MKHYAFIAFLALIISSFAFAQVGPPAGPPEAPSSEAVSDDPVQANFNKQLRTPLFSPAIDYNIIERIRGCRDEVSRGLNYHNCRDSREIYTAGLKAAKAQGKPLIVFFGFNKCPYCAVLHRQIFDAKRPMLDGNMVRYFSRAAIEDYGRKGEPLELPFIYIHARSSHGLKLADEIGVTAMAKTRGWHRVWSPFIVFVDPETEKLASQNYWEAPETHCDPMADFVVNLEELEVIKKGLPQTVRKRCKRRG